MKKESRPDRWQRLAQDADTKRGAVISAGEDLAATLQELADLQSEYQEWLDNLPENMQTSTTAEKLDAVTEIALQDVSDDPLSDWDSTSQAIEDALNVDLPRGFGRD